MKKVLFLCLSLLLLFACGKDDNPDKNPSTLIPCSSMKFQISINNVMIPTSIIEDYNKNIIVLGTENGVTKVLKIDSAGGLVWKKDFSNVDGKPARIIAFADNSLVFITKLINKHESFAGYGYDNIWIQNGYNRFGCKKSYEIGNDDNNYQVKSGTNLVKISSKGDIQWAKKIDRCFGDANSLMKYSDQSFVLLTMKFYGRIPDVIYDANGVFQDTVNYSMDSNMVYLSKYASDGKLYWETEVNHVFNMQYDSLPTALGIGITSSEIIIQGDQELISIDNGGTIVKREQMNNSDCTYELCSIGAIGNDVFISGNYLDYAYPYRYYIIKRLDGSNAWGVERNEYIVDVGQKNIITRELLSAFNNYYYKLKYYSTQGTLQWQYTCANEYACTFNCKEGITIAEQKNGTLQITRTDENGNY